MANYLDGLLDHAARRPQAPALSLPDRTLGHGAFAASVAGVAAGLAQLGLPVGAVVAVATRDRVATLRAVLGVMLGGRVALPFDPEAPPADLAGMLERTDAVALIADGPAAPFAGRPVVACDSLPAAADPFAVRHPGGDHWAQIVISSGTTGPSKAAPATHDQMLQRTRVMEPLLGLGPDDRHLAVIDPIYALGRHSVIRMLDVGGAVVLRPLPDSVPAFLDLLRAERVTYLTLTPSHVVTLLDGMGEGPEPALPQMRAFSVSGSPLPPADRLAVRRRLTPNLHINYGSNEAGFVTHAGPAELDRAPESVGRALPGIRVEVVDDGGTPVPPGTVGEVRVQSQQMSTGYVGVDEAGRGHRDGWFHLGDTGWFDALGHLHLAGRVDDRINFGGLKVYPFEVEAVLRTHPAVVECAVFGVPSRRYQEVVAAAVVLHGAAAAADLRDHCRQRLARRKVPALFLSVDHLPRNATGKVLVRVLREQLAGKAD